jgi:hypothetical protein
MLERVNELKAMRSCSDRPIRQAAAAAFSEYSKYISILIVWLGHLVPIKLLPIF